jgi:hypothetical protein
MAVAAQLMSHGPIYDRFSGPFVAKAAGDNIGVRFVRERHGMAGSFGIRFVNIAACGRPVFGHCRRHVMVIASQQGEGQGKGQQGHGQQETHHVFPLVLKKVAVTSIYIYQMFGVGKRGNCLVALHYDWGYNTALAERTREKAHCGMRRVMKIQRKLLAWLFSGVVVAATLTGSAFGEETTQKEFNIKGEGVRKENIFNLFFGAAPMMPTEHGTVILDAFFDENENQQWDEGEKALDRQITCVVDEIEYPVPAFIPGLENGMNYTLACSGKGFTPLVRKKNIFIKKRGQIIKIELPCLPDQPPAPLHAQSDDL